MECDSKANTLKPYLDCIQTTLRATLVLQNFPSESVERHNKPEIEIQWDASLSFHPDRPRYR